MIDVYYLKEYGELYEETESGSIKLFEYKSSFGTVSNFFLLRKIPFQINEKTYNDIVTPYGYGGPVAECNNGDISLLLNGYKKAFSEFCAENAIVTEFIRFHPLLDNGIHFTDIYETAYNRRTIAIDLTDDFWMKQFDSKCRNMVRKSQKLGVELTFDEAGESLEIFRQIYYKTMRKDNASDYYFFNKSYFDDIRKKLNGKFVVINACYQGEIIASSIFLYSERWMHYHLSATDPKWYSMAANNLILNAAAEFGRDRGFETLHLGGGLSDEDTDPLFNFKRSFGRTESNIRRFYTGRRIWDADTYKLLCQESGNDPCTSYFPAYRAKN